MSGYSGIVAMGVKVFLVLLGVLIIYLWFPEGGFNERKKRRNALARMNDFPVERLEKGPVSASHSLSSQVPPGTSVKPWRTSPRPVWHHDRINTFYDQCVVPYTKVLQHAGHLNTINALLFLLDQHGDCPSVVRLKEDREYQTIQNSRNIYDLLSKISLLDHSLNVAEQMIANLTKGKAKDPEMLTGKILVTALGHDIGKIPQLIAAQKYSKGDHPYISYLVLKKAIFTDSSPQQEDILKAVRGHHYPVGKGFTYDLRKADQAAREMESEQLSMQGEATSELVRTIQEQKISDKQASRQTRTLPKPEGTIREIPELLDLSWLDLSEFLSAVEPVINVVDDGEHFRALSMNNGLVYLTLDLVSKTVIQLAEKHNHPGILVNADTKEKKRQIEYTVKTLLDKEGFIPSFIGKGFSGARFGLINKKAKKKTMGIYMPVDARAFGTSLTELESRKKNAPIIKKICEVRPMIGKKK